MQQRDEIISFLKTNGVQAMFHYPGLHSSPYYQKQNADLLKLPFAENFANCLLRLPLHIELKNEEVELVCKLLNVFAQNKGS
jgi:dTDP-4-amino-4,6-dideoxygalactose transaminase